MTFFTAFAAANDMARILVYGVVDQLQSSTTSTCGGFVLKFLEQVYENRTPAICRNNAKCTVHTMPDIISATFQTGSKTTRINNEQLIGRFMEDNDFFFFILYFTWVKLLKKESQTNINIKIFVNYIHP